MNDRELLELAAKAAGIEYWVVRFAPKSNPIEKLHITKDGETVEWNPLTDDGDALRLAVKLQMAFDVSEPTSTDIGTVHCTCPTQSGLSCKSVTEYVDEDGDPYAATRRAIVRAAAEIGRNME